ncbi:MAG: serine/threonine protein kinase, partial [Planctomycetaceae bacterium]|nr:serine/threonine protein kinase [Planctomycetaceae bacterium]
MSLQQIDEICDEFESAVREGKAAAVEDYLLRIEDKEERRKLLRELLEIETEWSVESGTSPADKQNELKKRFPDETELIDSIVLRNVKQRQIGDYEIIEELGHGGMGIVYKAKQKLLNQTVAIKVLSQTLLNDRQAVGRFRREMQLIGSLNHPNIVRALNAGETAGTHYLVMEFIDGFTLAAGLAPPGGTSSAANTAAVCEAIRQAALGLQYANEFGLIHRDIKPANLMLDGAGTVKILDLGLGKFISEHRASEESVSLTQAGATLGTVDYMSPEQCENAETADIRSDIYSLGCTLYYLLTGAAPYSGSKYDSARKKLMAHIVGGIPDVRKINPDVPDALQAVLEKMLAKEPADRYQTPQKVAEALEPFASFDKLFALCGSTLNRSAVLPSDKTKRTTATLVDVSRRGVAPGKKRHLIGIILATVILAAGFAPYLLSKKSDTDNNGGNSLPVNIADEQPLRSTLRTDLALLPGLNGSWWFIETPLYLPFVRQKLIEEIDQTKDLKTFLGGELNFYYDSNVPNVYTQLDNIVKKFRKDFSPKESALLDKLAETGTSAEPETVYRKALTLAAELVPPGGASPAANVLHTQAVLEHYLAQLTNDKQLAVTAKKHYEEALTAYQKETAIKSEADVPASRLMEFLCLSDAARIEYFAGGNYNGALQKFTEVSSRRRTGERSSALFIAELYAAHGTLAAESGKYDDSLFVRGLERLNRSNAAQKMHPLAAQLAERYGWSLLDQWKVNEANKQFESALVIREANRKESGSPYSAISVLHDLHALALSLRYKGNSDRAVEEFRRTLTNIDGIIQKKAVPPDSGFYGVDWYIRNIKERAANTRER